MGNIFQKEYFKEKKGQVTVFIIIGIIILLSATTVIYIRNRTIEEKTAVEVEEAIIPDWAGEVEPFVERCIQDIAIKAFKKIGEHGGYIDFEDLYLSGSSFDIDKDNPTESDAVSFSTETQDPVAYWWYMESPNNCHECDLTSIDPPFDYIEGQVNRYMNRELPLCLNDFETFKKRGFEIDAGETDTGTKINLNTVDVTVKRPTEIKLGDKKANIDTFKVTLDLDFNQDYIAASLIAYSQINTMFMEDLLMHYITVYTLEPDPKKIPPTSSMDHREVPVTWKKEDVKKRVRNDLLGSYIAMLQVDKTKSAVRLLSPDPDEQGLYDVTYLDILPEGFEELEVDFLYNPAWNMYFNIRPGSETLKPLTTRTNDGGLGLLSSPITTNFYEFFYDISFPVIVLIKDNSSLKRYGEDGYLFRFALEVNIRDNKNMHLWKQEEGTIGPMDYSGVSLSLQNTQIDAEACTEVEGTEKWKCPIDNEVYDEMIECADSCRTETEEIIDPTAIPTLFCDYEQRISKDITIKTFDAKTKDPIPDVLITFGCGNYRKCPMEATDENGIYTSPFPICIGDGYIKLEKGGYMARYLDRISISPDTSASYSAELEPIREKEIEVVYINVTNLFRIKRMLYTKSGNNILNGLYNETPHVDSGESLDYRIREWGHGTLKNLYVTAYHYDIYSHELDLNQADIDLIKDKLKNHIENTVDSRISIKEIEHHHDVDRTDVVKATKDAMEAVEYALSISKNPMIQPEEQRDLLPISSTDRTKLEDYHKILKKELENIQFIKDYDLVSDSNIEEHRNKANPLKEGESVTIAYQKIKESIYEQNIPSVLVQAEYGGSSKIRLVPGRYNISMMFMDDKGFVIPAQGDYLEIDYTPAMIEGGELTTKTRAWDVEKTKLDSNNKIRFYFIRIDTPEEMEDMTGEFGMIEEYSRRYRAYIEPEFLP
ncbi:hypothetical protein KY366_02020 [Candidatus Woesearchaeota archaeon]|nr:hypothetical protein [Candidatus Woesearchaeota archaeon]